MTQVKNPVPLRLRLICVPSTLTSAILALNDKIVAKKIH